MSSLIINNTEQEFLKKINEAKEKKYEHLEIDGLRFSEIPKEIATLVNTLKRLTITGCYRLRSIDNLKSLINLEELSINYFSDLYSIDVIKNLPNLKSLTINCSIKESCIDVLAKCTNLSELFLAYDNSLKSLSQIKNLSKLTKLKLEYCNNLEDISCISELKNLEDLEIASCGKVEDLEELDSLSNLKTLNYSSNHDYHIEKVESIGRLTNLTSLTVSAFKVKNLDFIKNLSSLKNLFIFNCIHLEDIDAITCFNKLEKLSLEHCPKIKNIDIISRSSTLNELRIHLDSNALLFDLTSLASLTSLKSLSLYEDSTSEINGIEKLRNLESLTLFCKNVNDITPIAQLKKLTHLNARLSLECNSIHIIEGLTNLNKLALYINSNNQEDTSINVEKLKNLQSLSFNKKILNLRYLKELLKVAISHKDNLEDLSYLPKLTTIEISGCDSLENLNSIRLSSQIKDIYIDSCINFRSTSGIGLFHSLERFSTFDCENLQELVDFETLTKIRDIFCFSFQRTYTKMGWETAKALLLHRPYLRINASLSIEHIPFELTSPMDLNKIEDWYHEIEKLGYSTPNSLKVMLLGNGRIGKTQLARRLRGEEFDPSVPSTHGIQLDKFHEVQNQVEIQTWDFGGQDVYLGTHSLFIDNRALYLLLWTPASENNKLVKCEKIKIRNRPLSYWLAYLKSLSGMSSNVIVCQSQCDDPENDQHAPIPHPQPIGQLREVAISTKVTNGLDSFYPMLNRAIQLQLKRNGEIWLPNSWLKVENDLIAIPSQTTISYEYFEEVCRMHDVSTPETLATYLHQAGKIFYRKNCFSNRIILDQAWALQGVYLLLEREDALPNLMKMGGKFDIKTIERLLWKDQDKCLDKDLFLEMMIQCGVCFEISNGSYLAPDALPAKLDKLEEIEQVWQGAEANYHVRLNYEFLHDATMRYLLCKIGEKAKIAACYWRYGCCYYDSQHQSKIIFECNVVDEISNEKIAYVENYGQPGYIDIQVNSSSSKLIEHIVESIRETNHLDSKADIEWLKGNPTKTKGNESLMCEEQIKPFDDIGLAAPAPHKASPVYFTYAWGKNDADPKQAVSDRIFDLLQNEQNIEVFRDKDSMGLGDSIEEFERKIGRSAFVLMIISEKSLYESPHCMNELRLIYEHSQQQRDDFVARVIPVIMHDAKIDSVKDRLKVVRHWQTEKAELDDLVKAVGAEAAGSETAEQLRIMTSFINSIANTLHWLADLVIERTEELQAETAVELVKKRISESQ
ncbi:COR domain-containing protein [Vibrio gigantis]|uniref:COR domain-containing protein n=1 Tax=Vibrio gigantis TaxID=296199 RepID=UPI0035A5E7DA